MIRTKLNRLQNKLEEIKNSFTTPIISDYLDWFVELVDLHFCKEVNSSFFNKWDIYFVNLWKNIWSELNKTRPCIIYSKKFANFWDSVLIIPIKSYKDKQLLKDFHVFIVPTTDNKLTKDSYCDLSSIRQVSKKRINKKVWTLSENIIKEMDSKILKIFWIKKINREP